MIIKKISPLEMHPRGFTVFSKDDGFGDFNTVAVFIQMKNGKQVFATYKDHAKYEWDTNLENLVEVENGTSCNPALAVEETENEISLRFYPHDTDNGNGMEVTVVAFNL